MVDGEVSGDLGDFAELCFGSGWNGVDVGAGGEEAAVHFDFAVGAGGAGRDARVKGDDERGHGDGSGYEMGMRCEVWDTAL